MDVVPLSIGRRGVRFARFSEQIANRLVRGRDHVAAALHLGGRAADYDDEMYEFKGGAGEPLRRKHYDKSLRLLWKAEQYAPWTSFRDMSRAEKDMRAMAEQGMSTDDKAALERISTDEFRQLLQDSYTQEQRTAMVKMLSAIGHGEAYAWLVSARLLGEVKSTGAKAALTMQVLEEAKHFVVLRELVRAFDEPIPRQSAWEYLLMESVLKSPGIEKLFGMNVVIESIALSVFGLLAPYPGMEVLHQFHLDEARHCGLPMNYLREFPMTEWQKNNPLSKVRRLTTAIPAILIIFDLEEPLAVFGRDNFDYGGSISRKILTLSDRAGYKLPFDKRQIQVALNTAFNTWANATRLDHNWTDYCRVETTTSERGQQVEASLFGAQFPG
ncbi:MAG: hypothetical protein ACI9MC_002730 [Kiritimatiellia bacterium]|jgi:hypothetical protein